LAVLAVHALQLAEVGDDLRRLHLLVEALLLRQVAEAVLDLLRIADGRAPRSVPESGWKMLITMRMVVVLPAPFWPRKP
jgi:hypothetical protein